MAELLFELLSEEIPARMQARATADLKRLVADGLAEAGLAYTRLDCFVTPRRLALVVGGLPEKQPDAKEERKGPRVDAPPQAIQGFLGSVGLRLDQLEKRKTEKGEFYFAVMEKKGRRTAELLSEAIFSAISKMPWPKSMRWSDGKATWIRPLHAVLAVFGGRPIDLERYRRGLDTLLWPVKTRFGTGETVGHRFMAPKPFKVKDFADYQAKLRKAKVILDQFERRATIWERATQLAAGEGLLVKPDEDLLNEVTGLVEWPVPLIGRIDESYMALPPEVLTTALRHHLKYFSCLHPDARLAPRFVVVANVEARDGGKAIVAGNERVLRARLDDAKFYWDQDRKVPLASSAPKLAEMTFHAMLGTLDAKADRMQALAVRIAEHVPGADRDKVRSAARLAKADLTSGMVGEFPELQGAIGRYYALADGEHPEVADAIADHYAPAGPNDHCPTAPVSIAVALADKIDTLVGFFGIHEKPTGSKDPFALRRAALGAIRLIVENGLHIPLGKVFMVAHDIYPKSYGEHRFSYSPEGLAQDLLDFFADRLKVALKDKGVRHDLIAAAFAGRRDDDLVRLLARVGALQDFLGTEDGANLLTAYKRAANILKIEEKRDGASYAGAAIPALFQKSEERVLSENLAATAPSVENAIRAERFADAMAALARLRRPVDAFFDHVTVNCEDRALRENRLRLLSGIRTALDGVADFSRIEG
jgi:glycyl-tRNA synthetase beta chain